MRGLPPDDDLGAGMIDWQRRVHGHVLGRDVGGGCAGLQGHELSAPLAWDEADANADSDADDVSVVHDFLRCCAGLAMEED